MYIYSIAGANWRLRDLGIIIFDSEIITNISRRIWFPKTLKILFQIYYNDPFCSNAARNAPPQPFERTFDSLMNFCRGPLSASVWPRSRYANSLSYPRGRAQLEIRGTNARNDVPLPPPPPSLAYCGCIPKGSISVTSSLSPVISHVSPPCVLPRCGRLI